MQKDPLEQLLSEAKQLEKKYAWLQAAEVYGKTLDFFSKERDLVKAAEFNERISYCHYRAALQTKTNAEFRRQIKLSIHVCREAVGILEEIGEKGNQTRINHARASLNYVRSWLETDPKQKKDLLAKWWTLENQALKAYEQSGDLHSVGRTCNNLIEYSTYDLFWLGSDYSEQKEMIETCVAIAERAIEIFSKIDDEYELARAYISICWYYGFNSGHEEDENRLIQISIKCRDYANRGLELSQKIGDAWLISKSYHSAWTVAQMLEWDRVNAIQYSESMLKYGAIAKDNYLLGFGNSLTSCSIMLQSGLLEDPDRLRESFEKAGKMAEEATRSFEIINHAGGFFASYRYYIAPLIGLASIESNLGKRKALLEKAINASQEAIERLKGWKSFAGEILVWWSKSLLGNSAIETAIKEKKELLNKAQSLAIKHLVYLQKMTPFSPRSSAAYVLISSVHYELAKIESSISRKTDLLRKALVSIEDSIEFVKKRQKFFTQSEPWSLGAGLGRKYSAQGEVLRLLYSLQKDKKNLSGAIEAYTQASIYFKKAELPTHKAESDWNLAQLHNAIGDFQEASRAYELASEAYSFASEKIRSLKVFYEDYSMYMRAWSNIEQARYYHSIEDYNEARHNYEEAAKLHKSTSSWSYLAPNYFAWANMEKAENLSRKENTQQAKEIFKKAYAQFCEAEESFKQELDEITSTDEKKMTQKLFNASEIRRKYCQTRILIEEAKLLDRKSKYLQSSKRYSKAAQNISGIVDEIESETERKELEYLAVLCHAWEKMANAEETSSSISYLEAAELFEQAKEHCYTRKASLWALGNSTFCKGLAAGINYQNNADLSEHARAKSLMKSAETNYLQAGFDNASEYAKASQRLLDAYLYMNSAEIETFQDKRAKQYQMAENLLQMAAGSFMKAKQPEKATQIRKILVSVREEKALAASLSQVMQAPTIASTTRSFTAPTPTGEVSVGLEQFQHANVQANLITHVREVKVGESFCLAVELVNVGKEPALLTRVEDFVPPDFIVVKKPEIYRLEDTCLNMKGKQIASLKLVEVKLVLQPSKKGVYQLKPTVHYLDELGQNKSLQLKSVEIKVEEVILSDRVSTGTKELDSLLLGGIPKEYAIVLTGPPSDERELIIKNFLEAGIKEDQTCFCVTTEAVGIENLLEKHGFYLFLCNPKPKIEVLDLPNVTKLRSKTDINNLNMALARESRNLQTQQSPKRLCIEIISDVLLEYGSKTTRKWLAELITELASKGFTILAVMNPAVHPSDQANSILDLFDGEISITQSDDPLECKKSIQIKKLRNQDYIKNPICITIKT